MQVTLVGAVFLLAATAAVAYRRSWLPVILAISAAFPTTAAISFGENSIPPFYIVVPFAAVLLLLRVVGGAGAPWGLTVLFALFLFVALIPTIISPTIFSGLPILDPRNGIDAEVTDPSPLGYTPSMAAQVFYLAGGMVAALYLTTERSLSYRTFIPAALSANVVSVLFYIPAFATIGDGLFRNYRSVSYNPWEERHFGSFSEPSYLAVYATTTLVFCVVALSVRPAGGRTRASLIAGVLLSVANLLGSASGTALLTFVVVVVAASIWMGTLAVRSGWVLRELRWLRRTWGSTTRGKLLVIGIWGAIVLLLIVVAVGVSATSTQVVEKTLTLSFVNRTTSDLMALQSVLQTWGLGTGLGTSRHSSLLALVIGTTGVLGFCCFVLIIGLAFSAASRSASARPLIAALATLLIAKSIAESALSTPLLWLLIGLCFALPRIEPPDGERGRIMRKLLTERPDTRTAIGRAE